MSLNLAEELNDQNTEFEEPEFTDNLRFLCNSAIKNGDTSVSLYTEFECSSDRDRFIEKLQDIGFGVDYKDCFGIYDCDDLGHTDDCNFHCIITWKKDCYKYEYK